MNLLRKPKITTGLDIGASSIKLVQLEKKSDGYTLRGLGIKEVPADAVEQLAGRYELIHTFADAV